MALPLPSLERFAAALQRPETLAERGLCVPFTSPALCGARLRRRRGGAEPELLLPHPGRRDGAFVLPWSLALAEVAVGHADRVAVSALEADDPAALRAHLRRVAREGLYGRAARLAAAGPGGDDPPAEARAARRRVAALAAELAALAPAATEPEEGPRLLALARACAAAAAAAGQAMEEAAPGAAGGGDARAARAGWILDGFDRLAALWDAAGMAPNPGEERSSVLRAAPRLLPPHATEMEGWPGFRPWSLPAPAGGPPPRLAPRLLEGGLALWLRPC